MRQGQWIRAELREVFKPGQFVDIKREIFDCFRDPSLLARILVRRHRRQIVQILEVQVLAAFVRDKALFLFFLGSIFSLVDPLDGSLFGLCSFLFAHGRGHGALLRVHESVA